MPRAELSMSRSSKPARFLQLFSKRPVHNGSSLSGSRAFGELPNGQTFEYKNVLGIYVITEKHRIK